MSSFDVIWKQLQSLIEEMISNKESMLSEDIFSQYSILFDQLVQTIEDSNSNLTLEKMYKVSESLLKLEKHYLDLSQELKNDLKNLRIQKNIFDRYSKNNLLLSRGSYKKGI